MLYMIDTGTVYDSDTYVFVDSNEVVRLDGADSNFCNKMLQMRIPIE